MASLAFKKQAQVVLILDSRPEEAEIPWGSLPPDLPILGKELF